MSDDQFNQLMRMIEETNSIAKGTAVAVAILYDKFGSLEKEVIELKGMITRYYINATIT